MLQLGRGGRRATACLKSIGRHRSAEPMSPRPAYGWSYGRLGSPGDRSLSVGKKLGCGSRRLHSVSVLPCRNRRWNINLGAGIEGADQQGCSDPRPTHCTRLHPRSTGRRDLPSAALSLYYTFADRPGADVDCFLAGVATYGKPLASEEQRSKRDRNLDRTFHSAGTGYVVVLVWRNFEIPIHGYRRRRPLDEDRPGACR